MSEETSGDGPKAGKSNGKARVVPLVPLKREVSEKHLANLRASGLSDETIALAELYTESNYHSLAALVQRRTWFRPCGAALVFPFYAPGATEPHASRVRPSNPRKVKSGKKFREVKYDQAEAYGSLVYFAPRARAGGRYRDASLLYWTEGEKKTLVLDQLGLVCVGLTGVWNWGDKKHRDETGEERLHPMIREHVTVAGRDHVICFDADSKDNDNVMLAAARLCGVLLAAGALSVRFVCPPTKEAKGIDDFFAAFGEEVTRKLLEAASELEPADPKNPLQRLKKIRALSEAPVNDNLCLPEGYEVHKDGTVWRVGDEKHGDAMVSSSALLVQRYLDDYYTQEGRVDVCFDRNGWTTLCVARRALADSRTMVAELAPYGAPVNSNNAAKLVDWIVDLARVNANHIERTACVSRGGWHTIDGDRVFVLNEPVFADESAKRPLALDTRGDRKKLFGALSARGDAQEHLKWLKRAWEADPVAAAMICGALAAPLLEPLGAPNFAIHIPGESSKGKTTMLKIGASVYGDPHNDQWVASWNVTPASAELRAAALTDLPQCYDEVGSSDPVQTERMVYMLVNGGGKSRANRDMQLRETSSWKTIVLSTGERELANDATATGAQIRVIHLPLRKSASLSAAEIDELREGCARNAGSFGRVWIETLVGTDDWEPFRVALRTLTKHLRSSTPDDSLEGRVAGYFAVLAITESLACQLGLGEAGGGTMQRLFADQTRRELVVGLADRARELVENWVLSEPDSFPELEYASDGTEKAARGASRVLHGFRREDTVLFIPAQFRTFCGQHRLAHREVLREWQQRGWLQHDSGRLEKEVRVGRTKSRFYALLTSREEA